MTQVVDFDKLSNMIRDIIREELEEIRPLNESYIKKIKKLEEEEGLKFSSISELEDIIENV